MKNSNAYLVVGADSLVGASLIEALRAKGHKTYGTTRRKDTVSESRLFWTLKAQRHLLLHMMFHMLL